MNANHAHFELLCALGELGQLSPAEHLEFHAHCQSCANCRHRLLELTDLHATMVVTTALCRPLHQAPRGMTMRFIARANREGVPLRRRPSTSDVSNMIRACAAIMVLLIAGTVVGRNQMPQSPAPTTQAYTANWPVYSAVTEPNADRVKQPVSKVARSISLQRRIAFQPHGPDVSPPSSTPSSQPLIDQAVLRGSIFSALPETSQAGSFNSGTRYPRFKFSAPQEIAGLESDLLAACACTPLAPMGSRTNFAFASAQLFQPDAQAYGTALKPDFRPDPATFQFIESVRQ